MMVWLLLKLNLLLLPRDHPREDQEFQEDLNPGLSHLDEGGGLPENQLFLVMDIVMILMELMLSLMVLKPMLFKLMV